MLICYFSQENQYPESKEVAVLTEIRKGEALSESNTSFLLQLPSQFQGHTSLFPKQDNANNLVIKNILVLGTDVARNTDTQLPWLKKSRNVYALSPRQKVRNLFNKNVSTPECRDSEKVSHSNSCISTVVCYQNDSQNVLQKKQNDVKQRLPFDVIESSQKTECNSINMYNNNDQAIKIFTSQSTNSLSVVPGAPSKVATMNAMKTTTQYSSVKHRTTMFDLLKHPQSLRASQRMEKEEETKGGKVLNLTKEFEAKCNVFDKSKQRKRRLLLEDNNNNNNEDARSSTCSFINERTTAVKSGLSSPPNPASSSEDISVRKLVGKYEVTECNRDRSKSVKKQPPIPPRKSSLDINLAQTKMGSKHAAGSLLTQCTRGVTPMMKSFLGSNELKTVTKTHPLAKLSFCKTRNNPPAVFNTM